MQHTPFLVAAAFATALMGHTGQLPDFSGLDAVGELNPAPRDGGNIVNTSLPAKARSGGVDVAETR